MEREELDQTTRLLRATRSLAFNRKLLPLVKQSIRHSEKTIRTHLLLHQVKELRVRSYKVSMNTADEIHLTLLSDDDLQLPISNVEERHDTP